jgi:hypothetical protein
MDNKFLLVLERSSSELKVNNANGDYILEGTFGEIGVKNRNNRIYDESEYLPQIKSLQDKIRGGKLLGELDHPSNFDISLKNASHVIENLEYDKNSKKVVGRIRLLDTTAGREAKALVDAGVPIHISSRAAGVVESNGHVKIKKLFTYDLVAEPGFENAELKRVNESYGFKEDDAVQLFELPGNFNFDKYNIAENNTNNMSEFIKNEEFNKYTSYLTKEFAKINERIANLQSEKGSETNNGLVKYTEHLAEKLNQLHAYIGFIAESLDNSIKHSDHIAENSNNLLKYVEHVAKKSNEGINYTESVASRLDESISYSEKIAEMSNKIIEFTDILAEKLSDSIEHGDYIAEGLNNLVSFSNYLKENIETVGGYSNYLGGKIGKLREAISDDESSKTLEFKQFESKKTDTYKQDINEKLQLLIEAAQEQTAAKSGSKNQRLFESREYNQEQVPAFISKMPAQYRPIWENLSDSRKQEIVAESVRYDLVTEYQINNFWSTRDLRSKQVYVERLNESLSAGEQAKTQNQSGYKVNENYLESFKSQLESRFQKYSK